MDFARIRDRGKVVLDGLLLGGTLRARALRGGAFLGSASVAEQTSRFVRNMLLTRLLVPSAFGTMAIVMSSSAIVGTLTEVGLRAAVIQNPQGGEKEYLDAGWWMAMARAVGTYGIIFVLAPWVAHFYGNAELSALLRVTLLGTLFDGAMSPRSILTQKDMKFGRWVAISNGGAIAGVILTIVLAFVLRDVWALAIGFCGENAFRCVLSYVLCPGLPSLKWNRQVVRDLYQFSKGVLGLPFLNLIFTRTDIFVLGKLYSSTELGLYTMAVSLVQTPSIFVVGVLAQAFFPAVAHVQDDKERVNRILVEVTSWLILLGLPGVVVIYLCGHSLLSVIYGARYASAAGALAVAAVVVFLNVLNAAITCVFSGIGRPELHRRAVTACAIVMMISIYPACKLFGVVGGQIAALLAIIVSYFLQVARMPALTGLNLVRYGKTLVPALVVSGGLLGVGLGARFLGLATTPLANIALAAGACAVAYALCVPSFKRIKQTTEATPIRERVSEPGA
jgi:O-antigen/teichoic acid export membrane protein